MKKALVLFSLCLTCLLLVACGKANTTQNEKLSSKPKIEGFHYYGAIQNGLSGSQVFHRLTQVICLN